MSTPNKFRLVVDGKIISEDNPFVDAGSGAKEYSIGLCGNVYLFSVYGFTPSVRVDALIDQWSGWRDNTNKEIYHNDICELKDESGTSIRVLCQLGVATRAFDTGATCDIAGFYFLKEDGFKSFPITTNYAGCQDTQIMKIIGNIHQNKNLWHGSAQA